MKQKLTLSRYQSCEIIELHNIYYFGYDLVFVPGYEWLQTVNLLRVFCKKQINPVFWETLISNLNAVGDTEVLISEEIYV